MKLYYSAASPFVRKVMVVAMETGLDKKIETVTTPAIPVQANPELSAANPLQKVPALVTDGGEVLFDSTVICEYLDSLHDGRKLFPPAGGARWKSLVLMSLADGMADAGVLQRYEAAYHSEEKRSAEWISGQGRKIAQGLDQLEKSVDEFDRQFGVGEIAVACAVGWLEFRKPNGENRPGRPKLFAWFDAVTKRPSLVATMPRA